MLSGFSNRSDICEGFNIDSFDGTVIFASYDQGGYEGDAAVVYVHDDKLYLVSGSHCSCMGLEGQWAPEEVTVDVLKKMTEHGYGEGQKAAEYVTAMLDKFHVPDVNALLAYVVMSGEAV